MGQEDNSQRTYLRHKLSDASIDRDADPMITYVEVEQEESGYYLFRCSSPGHVVWDTWHETLDDALQAAEESWGVTRDAWTPFSPT